MFGYPPDYLGDRNLGDQSRFNVYRCYDLLEAGQLWVHRYIKNNN